MKKDYIVIGVVCFSLGIIIGQMFGVIIGHSIGYDDGIDYTVDVYKPILDEMADMKDECMEELEFEEWKAEYMIDQYESIGKFAVGFVSAVEFVNEDYNLTLWSLRMDNETRINRTRYIENKTVAFHNETDSLFRNDTVWRDRYVR